MKKRLWFSGVLAGALSVSAVVTIDNVSVAQRPGEQIVDITYDPKNGS